MHQRLQMCATIFPMRGFPNHSARLLRDKLCTITYSQHREIVRHLPYIRLWCSTIVHRKRTSRENYAFQICIILYRFGAWLYLTVNIQFPDASSYQLGVLGAEIKY